MSDPEVTVPPHKPNTPRVWIPRLWKASCALVEAHPDKALVLFLLLLAAAVIF